MISQVVNELIEYAKTHLDLHGLNVMYIKNFILGELEIYNPSYEKISLERLEEIKDMEVPDYFVDELTKYLLTKGFSEKEAENKIVKIFGLLSPLPNCVAKRCEKLASDDSAKALDYLYNLSIYNYYFQKTKVDKNIVWKTDRDDKNIEISINLSKPEKSNKDIAKLLVKKSTSEEKYPKCLLCYENLGFFGSDNHPARENIRFIPINFSGKRWYLQYSPYGYFYKHCIVLDEEHSNMVISHDTFKNLCDFVDLFPSFFLGSNADLPIVGGSILNHGHYQGGEHLLPVMEQDVEKEYIIKGYKSTHLYKLDWYNSCLLIKGKDKDEVIDLADKILNTWRHYSDAENEIISDDENGNHNTITPSAKKVNDEYYLYLILRNNRCNEEYPDGIFHAHKEHHHIKKEGIGIIEAMGRFILPARLIRQCKVIKESILEGVSTEKIIKNHADLDDFKEMIDEIRSKSNGSNVDNLIKNYIEDTCIDILKNTAVFKDNEIGNAGLDKFIGGL